MNRPVKILALAGSYRRGSFDQALVFAAREEPPENIDFREFDLREVPFYDGDVEEAGLPPDVERLKAAVRDADALLLVTPEYNSGIPAVLKNCAHQRQGGGDHGGNARSERHGTGTAAAAAGCRPHRRGSSRRTRVDARQSRQLDRARTGPI